VLERTKDGIHLPNRIINLKVKRIEQQIKQNVGINLDIPPRLRSNKFSNSLPNPVRSSETNQSDTTPIISSQKEPSAMPTIIRLWKIGSMIAHRCSTIVNLWCAAWCLLDVDIFAEKVKPRG